MQTITNRLTQLFSTNQSKIDKYESVASVSSQEVSNDLKYNRPAVEVNMGYRKY